jgi:branched-subunit amino acid transport protein
VSPVWLVVLAVGLATVAIKAAGPVLLGGRALPPRVAAVITLLAPALLAALVAINTFGGDRALTVDARMAGVAAAGLAIWRRAPLLLVVVLAAGVTAVVRAVG